MRKQQAYLIFCFSLILISPVLLSQHYQFSQFYSAPTYLNPAFTGAGACARFSMNYRKQWAGVPGAFTTYQVSGDHYAQKYKSGFGFQFFNDKAGASYLSTTAFNLLYAYETKINKILMGRAGIYAGMVQRKADFDAFTFADQITRGGASSSIEPFSTEGVTYFDAGAGGLLYSKSTWLGLSVAHLNRPNQSLMFAESTLPMEIKLHGGYRYVIHENESSNRKIPVSNFVTAAFNYKHENNFNQLDLGIYYAQDAIVLGVWYRGLPIFKPVAGYANNDAIIFLMGFNIEKLKLGYSYDLTLSNLTNVVSRGTHEISLSYQFCKLKRPRNNKKRTLISCPKF
ncbi:MAG TPA: type IX secretion system membrane protein PorP/SprF [Bacteroidia bacterium]|nr:type IX secretion system membrane protein PorP/SprF [Bacteroidia bacterium]